MKTIIMVIAAFVFTLPAFSQQKIDSKYPKATIAGKGAGYISASEITTAGKLLASRTEFKIVHFTFSTRVGDKLVTVSSYSSKISDEMIGLVKNMKKGQKLFVDEIKASQTSGPVVNLESLTFFIN